jgi:hypothetical protein
MVRTSMTSAVFEGCIFHAVPTCYGAVAKVLIVINEVVHESTKEGMARMSTAGKARQVSVATQQKVEKEWKNPRNWRPGCKFGPPLPGAKPLSYRAIQKRKTEEAWTYLVEKRKEVVVEHI